jgi:hypothetical protein
VEVKKSRVPLVDVVVPCIAATASSESRRRSAPPRRIARRQRRAFVVPDALVSSFIPVQTASQTMPESSGSRFTGEDRR